MSQEDKEESLPIGERIRRLRESAGLTVEELAERSGLTMVEIQNIEQDMISPALGILTRVSEGLGIRMGHFFDQGPRKLYSIVRADDQKVTTRFASKSGTDHGYQYFSLGAEKRERIMEPFVIEIHPPSDPSGKKIDVEMPSTHSGEEFLYVLEGEIEVQLEDQTYVLYPGDSAYYDASVHHRVIHHGSKPSKTLAIIHLPRKS